MTAGDIVKKMKRFIYNSLNLKELAVKAKDAGLIVAYYDVIEALFEPEQIIEIIAFITEFGLAYTAYDLPLRLRRTALESAVLGTSGHRPLLLGSG